MARRHDPHRRKRIIEAAGADLSTELASFIVLPAGAHRQTSVLAHELYGNALRQRLSGPPARRGTRRSPSSASPK